MADPISFDPFLGWVDITDPNNIPADARVIGADDLLRYENFGKAAKDRLNELSAVATDGGLADLIQSPGSEVATALAATIDTKVKTKAEASAVAKEAFPLRGMTVTARGTDPIPCGEFGGYLWGTSAVSTNATLYRSNNGGDTWTQYGGTGAVPIDGRNVAQGVQLIRPTGSGEVLAVSMGNVLRSTNWASGTPTWTVVLVNPTASYFYPWGFAGEGNKFIIVHYGGSGVETPNRADSRYGWISLDGGMTWTIKWDVAARFGDAVNALTHIHAVEYDPWEDRFFVCEGHDTATGVYVSTNNGDTWTRLDYGESFTDGTPLNAPTVCVATDDGIVFGSDDMHNGIYVLPRGASKIEHAWAWGGITNTQLLGYAWMGWRDPATGVVYVSYISDETDLPAPVAASDGRVANQVWQEPGVFGMWRKLFIHNGKILMWEQLSNLTAKGRIGGVGQIPGHKADSGRVLGGTVTGGRKSLAVGREAVAKGDASIAVGGGATTTTHNGTAVGGNAVVTGTGTAVGAEAKADALGLAVGYQASTTGSLSLGASSLTASVSSTAVGRGARAATDAGGANVNSTAIGRDAKASAASGSATAIGYAAISAGARAVAVGSAASSAGVDSVAIGESASATAQFGIALGKSATATHTGSVALGANAATTATDQIKVGPKHTEYAELAADPAAPAVNNARVYFKDNGAGKTQMCVRFNTGAVVVIATEP